MEPTKDYKTTKNNERRKDTSTNSRSYTTTNKWRRKNSTTNT